MFLDATRGPVYEPLETAALRQQTLKNAVTQGQRGQQDLQIGSQNLATGAQDQQMNALKLQQLQMQMDSAKAMRDALNPAAQAQSSPNSPSTPAPSSTAPSTPTLASLGRVAGPNDALAPGMIGIANAPAPAPAAGPQAPTPAQTPGFMDPDEADRRVQASNASYPDKMAFHASILAHKEAEAKLAEAQGKVSDQEKDNVAGYATNALKAGLTPGSIETFRYLVGHANNGAYAPHLGQYDQFMQANPDKLKDFFTQLATGTAAEQTAQGRVLQAETAAKTAAIKAPGEQAAADQLVAQNDARNLSQVTSPQQFQAALDAMPHGRAKAFAGITFDPADVAGSQQKIRNAGLNVEQATTAAQQASNAAETKRAHLSTESNARLNSAIAGGRLAQEQMVNGMKYGPGTQEYWVQQIAQNPDSVKEMPPELRSAVGQKFAAATGLPLPTPISGNAQGAENAARNALDGAAFIQKALQNPAIARNIGPIMGRLGNAQQNLGQSLGLSPQDAQLAQELRTRMQYFVFQEGKAVLGGRLPQNLMQQLETSSANVKMDPNMLTGALNGAASNALSIMDNADKQRFGGKMRPRGMRGLPGGAATPNPYAEPAANANPYR